VSLATLAIAGPHLRAHQLERILERRPPQGRRCPGPAVTPDRQENSERSPRVWIDVELGATIGSPAGSIEVVLQAFRNVIGPPTENDDRLAARRQRTHHEGAHTEYDAVMQSIFRAVGSDRPAGRSTTGSRCATGTEPLSRWHDGVVMTNGPRVIGMLGGMSWESSAQYYRLANELVRERLGGLHSARVLLASVDFAEIEQLQTSGRWDEAGQLLAEAAKRLEAGGAELLLICTNTMHKVADQVQAAVDIPLLHLVDATAQAITQAGLSTVGLLGTAFTMEQNFCRDRLASHGFKVLVPSADDRAEVHRVIYDELCVGVLREESRQVYRDVITRLVLAGVEGVVLGCTEIELLISAADSSVPIFPTTRLHVEAAVHASLNAPATA